MQLNAKTTALVLIDLQKGVLARPLLPTLRAPFMRDRRSSHPAFARPAVPSSGYACLLPAISRMRRAQGSISRATRVPCQLVGMSFLKPCPHPI